MEYKPNEYTVNPGLYAVGKPDRKSDVFVTANYKLSFDHLRKNLGGINAWILVLDTKGINVWCAAGKGTFGTMELVNRIEQTRLPELIEHRRLIVPQLGATGISAHQVKQLTSSGNEKNSEVQTVAPVNFESLGQGIKVNQGFRVIFGPVRAADIPEFIQNKYKSTSEMRRVKFNFYDRIILTPVDLVYNKYKLLAAFALILILAGIGQHGYQPAQLINKGLPGLAYLSVAYLGGIVITPALLPYIPVKMFAFKGFIIGGLLSVLLYSTGNLGHNLQESLCWTLIISAVSSFMAMNFTGASTFTSLAGVKKEMRYFVPIQIAFTIIGLGLFVSANFN